MNGGTPIHMTRNFETSEALNRLPEQFFAKLVKKVQSLANEGHDIINLGQGNPDQPTPQHIVDRLKQAADNPNYHKYSPFRGQPFLKEAVCDFYKREYNVDLDPETEVAILFGAKTGLVEISQCLLNNGDVALLPDPGYPDYLSGMALSHAKIETMPLTQEHDFLPDYGDIDAATLDKAKLMFLNYPNNPTAGVATPSFFDETVEIAKKHHICVVHDFAYGALGFDGEKPPSFLASEGAKDIGVEMYTLSKTFNMAGWRIAFAVGNPSVIESLNLIQDHMYVSIFGAIQEAAAHALQEPEEAIETIRETYEKRRDAFMTAIHAIGWKAEAPKGSFFAWLPIPNGFKSEEFADLLLEKAHVVVAPGNGFGEYGEGYIRVGLLTEESRLLEAVKRIEKLALF